MELLEIIEQQNKRISTLENIVKSLSKIIKPIEWEFVIHYTRLYDGEYGEDLEECHHKVMLDIPVLTKEDALEIIENLSMPEDCKLEDIIQIDIKRHGKIIK